MRVRASCRAITTTGHLARAGTRRQGCQAGRRAAERDEARPRSLLPQPSAAAPAMDPPPAVVPESRAVVDQRGVAELGVGRSELELRKLSRLQEDATRQADGRPRCLGRMSSSGEVVGLLGPNGAGKTTCFYMIVGLVGADAGTITLDGEDLTRLPIHRRARLGLSYLPQEASVFRKLDGGKTTSAPCSNCSAAPTASRCRSVSSNERLEALLEDLQIHAPQVPTARCRCRAASGAACEIARALATSPRFILLDEPFAGIDPIAVHRDPAHRPLPQGTRHRRSDHRPQRARDAGHLRPRVHHQRGRRARCSGAPDEIVKGSW